MLGWYAGYVGGFIAEAILGSKLIDTLADVSSTVNRLKDATRRKPGIDSPPIGKRRGKIRTVVSSR